jgi:TonB family protein
MKKTSGLLALLLILPIFPASAVPPYKVQRPPPKFPKQARLDRTEGMVVVQVEVRQDGGVARAMILSSTPPVLFDDAARSAALRWHFQPLCGARFDEGFSTKATIRFSLEKKSDANSPPVFAVEDESSKAANPCSGNLLASDKPVDAAPDPQESQAPEPVAEVRERPAPAL